jgi:serine protease AprX
MRRLVTTVLLLVCLGGGWAARPQSQTLPTLSSDLHGARHSAGRVRIIVQADDSGLQSLKGRLGRILHRDLGTAVAIEVSQAELDEISKNPKFAHISSDLPVMSDMAVTNKVTGASTVWQGTSGLLGIGGTPGYNGTDITVAVIDSGIAAHTALGDRVKAHVNLVSSEPTVTGDPFGHGTHLAGTIGGAVTKTTTAYAGGTAPGVNFVDVRVLGKDGSGYTSDVIAGIDWATANRARYGIRIINLSLGHPVVEPVATDPLCAAVARAVSAGLVVVTSAGNYGLTSTGQKVLGGITSPGNSPLAITVGALDTAGTADRGDDTVAAYSSRGPTRFDMGVKPDLVAPGTRITSLESSNNYLVKTYPTWHVAGSGTNAYMRLSGTSMAAAVVSGGAALLLDQNPYLTPAQVKLALQMGTRFMPAEGLIGAGTGSVDFVKSRDLSKSGLVPSLLGTVTNLLGLSSGATFRDTGTLIDRVYDRTGVKLLGLLDLSFLWSNAGSAEWGVLNLAGSTNPLGYSAPNYLVWGNVAGWSSSYYLVWGNTIQDPQGEYLVWGNNEYSSSNYLVWGNAAVVDDPNNKK